MSADRTDETLFQLRAIAAAVNHYSGQRDRMIREAHEAGISWNRIAEADGRTRQTIWELYSGNARRRRPVTPSPAV